MNSLAFIYFNEIRDLKDVIRQKEFIDVAVKYRAAVFFPHENKQMIETLEQAPLFSNEIHMCVLKGHECINPHLILQEGSEYGKDVPILAEPHQYWVGDVDVWYNVPDIFEKKLKTFFPNAYFGKLVE